MRAPDSLPRRMRGLSLVELMVALTIGLIILAAISSLFAGSKQTYNVQDSLARLQENARFAVQSLVKDVRLAGYFGCLGAVDPGPPTANPDASVESGNLRHGVSGGTTFTTNAFVPIEGIDEGAGTWYPSGNATLPAGIVAGTDALTVRMADTTVTANVTPGMLNGASTLTVDNASPFAANDIVVVSDCGFADIMQVTGIAGNNIQHGVGTPGNVSISLTKAYVPPARVFKIKTRQYYIAPNTNNGLSLFVRDNGGTPNELVEGIENMQITYGEDTDSPPDGIPNIYRTAGNVVDWTKVMSVRIGLLAKTIESKDVDTDSATYDVNGKNIVAPGDHARRRVFQVVIQLRNT